MNGSSTGRSTIEGSLGVMQPLGNMFVGRGPRRGGGGEQLRGSEKNVEASRGGKGEGLSHHVGELVLRGGNNQEGSTGRRLCQKKKGGEQQRSGKVT